MIKNKSQHEKLMDIAKAIDALGIGKKGLLEQIRAEQNKPEVNPKPPRRPKNFVIYSGIQFAEILQKKYPKIFGYFKY